MPTHDIIANQEEILLEHVKSLHACSDKRLTFQLLILLYSIKAIILPGEPIYDTG